jgi:hypothetical protein
VRQRGLLGALEFGDDRGRQRLAELDAPLVERVDVPDHALGEDAVLVQGDHRAEQPWSDDVRQQHVGGPVALHHPVGHNRLGCALGPHLIRRLAEGERLGLSEDVGGEDVVVVAELVERAREPEQVDGDELRPLMDELVEAVLPVRARLAPVHGTRVVIDGLAGQRDVLPA